MYPLGNPTATGGLLLVLHCPSAMYVYHRLCRLLLPRSRTPPAGAGWAIKPSKVATEVLARHAHDHNRRHLLVTVLEARGLTPRRGVVVALRWEGGGGGAGEWGRWGTELDMARQLLPDLAASFCLCPPTHRLLPILTIKFLQCQRAAQRRRVLGAAALPALQHPRD